MMLVQNESTTTMRVFNWNAADAAPTSVVRTVAASVFTNPGVVRLRTPSAATSIYVSAGAANRSDGRYGDYVTTQRYQGCNAWFGATAYSWDTAPVDAADDVDARWVEFGREGDRACYNAAQ